MLANYGYVDGSGEYYITIDTDKCIECTAHSCTTVCPKEIFEIIEDDYDDMVAAVKEDKRKSIAFICVECKPSSNRPELPCVVGCEPQAISHGW